MTASQPGHAQQVGISPWGPDDEIRRLNLITPESRAAIMSRVDAGKTYDLATEYYIGMPSWHDAGDPHFQFWMTHTPKGRQIDDPMGVGAQMNATRSYIGTAFSMYSHTLMRSIILASMVRSGTVLAPISIWAIEPGSVPVLRNFLRSWREAYSLTWRWQKGVEMLPDQYRITRQDLRTH